MFKYFDNKFTNYSLRIKLELYILPLIMLYFIYYLNFDTKKNTKNIKVKIDINTLVDRKFEGSYLTLFSSIEYFSSNNQIYINTLEQKNNMIYIKGNASINNIKKLISFIENINSFSKIVSFNIEKSKKIYTFSTTVSMENFYFKKLQKIKNKKQKIKKLNLIAIIDNYIFINNHWLQKGDEIANYHIDEIGLDFITLKDERNNKKTLWIEDEAFRKYFD